MDTDQAFIPGPIFELWMPCATTLTAVPSGEEKPRGIAGALVPAPVLNPGSDIRSRNEANAADAKKQNDDEHLPEGPATVPLEGGTQAWLQVAASFALYWNHLGLLNTFGVFQSYYETHLLSSSSPSAIAWIGSVQVFCLMSLGAFIGPLFDMGYCRTLLVAGTLLVTLGFMLTSISTLYWHVLLAQGVCIGLGACCLSIPSIAIVPMYFKRRRATAMGLANVGSGLGSTLYPLMFQRLLARMGFGWAVRIMGFIALVLCVFAIVAIRDPRRNGTAESQRGGQARGRRRREGGLSLGWFWDSTALKEPTFVLYSIASFFGNLAIFDPPYYLQGFALSHGMQGHALAPYLLAILNASSIPGRVLPSLIADWVGSLDTYTVVLALTSSTVYYWISVTTPAGNIAFSPLYGFFSGATVSLGPVVLASITSDFSRLGTRLGMVSILKGVGSLVGPPISGAILSRSGSYLGMQLFAASATMLSSVLNLTLRLVVAKKLLKGL